MRCLILRPHVQVPLPKTLDTCNGDSGGPAYLNLSDGSQRGIFKVAGLTSRAANSSTVNCGDGGIYTLIPAYLPWLYEVTNGLIGSPAIEEIHTEVSTTTNTDSEGLFISAVLPNPEGQDDGNEWIEITNTSTTTIDLTEVLLMDKQGGRLALSGSIEAGITLQITIPDGHALKLGNSGDSIKLVLESGLLIHEVGYDKTNSGKIITFDLPTTPEPQPEPQPEPEPPTDDCGCGKHDDCDGPIDSNFTPGALRC